MRILQLIQRPQLRGAEIFASQLSGHLVNAGHEVMMVSLFSGGADLPFRGQHVCLERDKANRFLDWTGWNQLASIIQTFKPDVIQSNAGDTLKFAVFSKLLFGWSAPLIFRNANKVSDFIDTRVKRSFNKFLVSQVSHVISVSETCRKDFVATYLYPEGRTTVVPIGIEISDQVPSSPDGLSSVLKSRPVLAHVASFVSEKNHIGLLRIIGQLAQHHAKVMCIMVGDGKLRDFVETEAKRLHLDQYVHFAGYRNDVAGIMAHADVLVLPSLIEGLPGVILEAMRWGTPVVANDVGGIAEVVQPGETGWLVAAKDEHAFVNAVNEAILGSNRDRIIENARRLVTHEFNNQDIAERFLAVYRSVASK